MMCSSELDTTKRHHIFVYEVYEDGTLSGRRLFASVGVYDGSSPGLGVPDGIKVDTKGRVYIGTPDGVQGKSRCYPSLIIQNSKRVRKPLPFFCERNNGCLAIIKLAHDNVYPSKVMGTCSMA